MTDLHDQRGALAEATKEPASAPFTQSRVDKSYWRRLLPVLAGRLGVLVAIVVVWEWFTATGRASPLFVGQPSAIAKGFVKEVFQGTALTEDAVATVQGAFAGYALASALAIVCAFLVSRSEYVQRVVEPYFTAFNSMPRVALAPLFVIWFGVGLASKMALSASLAFFVVFAATMGGILGVDKDYLLLAKVLGFTRPDSHR